MNIETIKAAWSVWADENNQWDQLDADERVNWTIEYMQRISANNATKQKLDFQTEVYKAQVNLYKRQIDIMNNAIHEAAKIISEEASKYATNKQEGCS